MNTKQTQHIKAFSKSKTFKQSIKTQNWLLGVINAAKMKPSCFNQQWPCTRASTHSPTDALLSKVIREVSVAFLCVAPEETDWRDATET